MDNTEKKPKGAGKSSFELIDSDRGDLIRYNC